MERGEGGWMGGWDNEGKVNGEGVREGGRERDGAR